MKANDFRKREGFNGQKLIVLPKKIINDFLNNDAITRQLHITDIGYYPKARFHYAERNAGIGQHILIYCLEGFGWVEINKKRIEIGPSEFVVIPKNSSHRYGASEHKPWTIYWIHFKGELAGHIVELILKNAVNFQPKLAYNEERIALFDDIYHTLEMGYSSDALRYVSMTFSHFLSSLMYERKFTNPDHKTEEDIVERSVGFMKEKIQTSVTLSELAEFSRLSVSHFSSIFKAKTGYSPIEYFNHLKIQHACQYLSFTDMSVKQVAITLGIHDPYYFTRMFTRLMGVSPTAYRKKQDLVQETK
jgi:AraC-like DNA-binding protein